MSIVVSRGRSTTTIERETFESLMEESWQQETKDYLEGAEGVPDQVHHAG